MYIYQLGNISDKKQALSNLGVHGGGLHILSQKMELFHFYIKDLPTPAVNILKQDALSIGADLAVPSGVILCEKPLYDCILIGTAKHIEILSKKELSQDFGLKKLAKELSKHLKIKKKKTQIMGVINANEDSFFEESRYNARNAILEIQKMIKQGADIIDIGAVSSRPLAKEISEAEELLRVKPICDLIFKAKLYEKAIFSIDSYTPSVIEYALKSGFKIINDITGGSDERVISLAVEYKVKLCIMHMQGRPQTMQQSPQYEDIMQEVSHFFTKRISKCEALGLERKEIILDVGIGFGKTLEHNISLLKNMAHFRHFGCEVLVGASRKSLIDDISASSIQERLAGTLVIHLDASRKGAEIIRCHDVYEHHQALRVQEALDA